jgi:hypothetical protein
MTHLSPCLLKRQAISLHTAGLRLVASPQQSYRAGRMIRQPVGCRAFVPAALPRQPPLAFDAQLATVLAKAGTALGRLDGVAATLPKPELFVARYVHFI